MSVVEEKILKIAAAPK